MTGIENLLLEHQQEELTNRELGFWLYLMTDAIIFALLFATYVVMFSNTAGGTEPAQLFDLSHVGWETTCLLLSSTSFGLAWLAVQADKRQTAVLWLVVTCLLGVSFLGLEIKEFVDLINQQATPQRSGYLSAFFTLVATHGLHVSIGLLGILVMIGQLIMEGRTAPVISRLFRLGLFWHFLDIIWIGIFSVVYLPVFIR
ncbi:cytochrome c oxidase subunit 3 [Parendozoicomonas haliclonae]|uniref:Cytochrome bo(3) ubiquinol oxidase subunit 3 n=1 Tax=Parendozoicomonas haliclonae TaxID=1960125 RepID=A0A1X7AK70_9GAMM|nr:cytochrome c oxidase subunit 3 [Parendozoicomonas haliclonae]SMA46981.1 Cytochrome bo(3) ubiquinol oxidase subunit 3 [Parendozoicomonas haliclonae]